MGNDNFGSRVIGEEAYAKALKTREAGADVFGKRVVGDAGSGTSEEMAKTQSQFGARVVMGAQAADHEGKKGSTLAVEDLENILTENPTFFDSLFENELARAGGPRPEALTVFGTFEVGPKGADRQYVMAKINGLLGKTDADAAVESDAARATMKHTQEVEQRSTENRALDDAGRIKALAEREKDLDYVRKHNPDLLKQNTGPASSSTDLSGKTPTGGDHDKGPVPNSAADRKPEDTKPETQSHAPRPTQKKAASSKKK